MRRLEHADLRPRVSGKQGVWRHDDRGERTGTAWVALAVVVAARRWRSAYSRRTRLSMQPKEPGAARDTRMNRRRLQPFSVVLEVRSRSPDRGRSLSMGASDPPNRLAVGESRLVLCNVLVD